MKKEALNLKENKERYIKDFEKGKKGTVIQLYSNFTFKN